MHTIEIRGRLNTTRIKEISHQIEYLANRNKVINLVIDSYGGNLEKTIEVIGLIEEFKRKGVKFHCHIIRAESAAVLFAMACDERTLCENAIFCIHIGGIFLELDEIQHKMNKKIVEKANRNTKTHWELIRKYINLKKEHLGRLSVQGNVFLKPNELEDIGFAKVIQRQTSLFDFNEPLVV